MKNFLESFIFLPDGILAFGFWNNKEAVTQQGYNLFYVL